jgi:predicted aspartyl protease
MPIPPAVLDDSLVIEGEKVPAREFQERMTVPVFVNGRGPFRFVVDSGADRTVVGRRLAAALALPPRTTATLHSMTGASSVPTVQVEQLKVGSATVWDLTAPVLEERHLGADGILGIDSLIDQRLLLDFGRDQIVVQDARPPIAAVPGEIVVVARRRRGQLILTQGTIEDRPVEAVIDTGAQVTIGNMALRRRLLGKGGPESPATMTLISVTGETIAAEVAHVPELRFGKLGVRNLTIAFVDAAPFRLFGLADRPALLLGADVLRSFQRVSLDFRRRKVRFQVR